MNHSELNIARATNMMDDTRRYLLKVRQGLSNDDPIYLQIKSTISNLEEFGRLSREGDFRMRAFDGVFFLRNDESQDFVARYRAHMTLNKKGVNIK